MRQSFIVHADTISQFDLLTDEQAGRVLKALLKYVATGEEPVIDDGASAMLFAVLKTQILRDSGRYDEVVAKRRAAAQARWAAKNDAHACTCMTSNAHACYSDSDSVSDSVSVSDSDSDSVINDNNRKEKEKEKRPRRFTPPALVEVQSYIQEKGYAFDAQQFMDYYESNGWKVGRNAMKDWRAAVRNWARRETEKRDKERRAAEPTGYEIGRIITDTSAERYLNQKTKWE